VAADPFQLLGLAPSFDLDEALVQRRFLEATAQHHPDRYTDPVEQAEAAERCARINAARDHLADPERRANCLLELLGGPGAHDDHSLPPDLLDRIMEARERMAAAIAADDAPALQTLSDWARQQRREHLGQIATHFRRALATTGSERRADLEAARVHLNALRYFQRMLEQVP
jgi:molecular chaperone HscB